MDEKCEESSSQDERSRPSESQSAKKRKKFGTVREVMKKLRASTFETGPDCECKTHQCFRKIPPQQRSILIKKFNELGDWNKQSAHLAGLIKIVPIKRRYAKGDEEEANFRDCSFHYKIRMEQNDGYQEEVVDQSIVRDWKAFFGEPTVCRYVNKCPFPTRPIKEAKISKEHPRFIQHREMYNAAWVSSVLTTPEKRSLQSPTPQEENTFLFPNRAYEVFETQISSLSQ
uniref:Uncharacterized protein n=1 Tax=Timema tahoe TaxID=61484 RepID=A0A7R9IPI5_9NEOP|nr:unnamed protein product [Timema tahoe]